MMTNEARDSICKKALDIYGIEKQSLVACEELAELTKEISKAIRKGTDYDVSAMIEELADVTIIMNQLELFYHIDKDDILEVVDQKLERLEQRLEGKEEKIQPKYRPFKDIEELFDIWEEKYNNSFTPTDVNPPTVWVRDKDSGHKCMIIEYSGSHVFMNGDCCGIGMKELLEDYTFLNGEPCGVEVTE